MIILVGLVGVLVPVLPGLLLVLAGIAIWAFERQDAVGWAVLAVAAAAVAAGSVAKYLLPGRRLRAGGVPWTTLALGGMLGIVGFFVVPVIGLPLGFVLGIYVAEYNRIREPEQARRSTRQALVAVGFSMLIELAAALLAAGAWLVGVLVSS